MPPPWQSPAIPNASRCWLRSATTSASSMMWGEAGAGTETRRRPLRAASWFLLVLQASGLLGPDRTVGPPDPVRRLNLAGIGLVIGEDDLDVGGIDDRAVGIR